MTRSPLEVEVLVDPQVPMPDGFSELAVERVVKAVLDAEGALGTWDVSIVFAGDDELQRLHRDYLNDDSPTDIMTFPHEADDSWFDAATHAATSGGDIAISVDRAEEQRADEGWDITSELLFLVAHGMLHLLGWDDATPVSRAAMLDRQREILKSL